MFAAPRERQNTQEAAPSDEWIAQNYVALKVCERGGHFLENCGQGKICS